MLAAAVVVVAVAVAVAVVVAVVAAVVVAAAVVAVVAVAVVVAVVVVAVVVAVFAAAAVVVVVVVVYLLPQTETLTDGHGKESITRQYWTSPPSPPGLLIVQNTWTCSTSGTWRFMEQEQIASSPSWREGTY